MQSITDVLLAEDDQYDRFFFNKSLSQLTIATSLATVESAKELKAYLDEHVAYLPDVLFMDFTTPGRNGLECLAEIKQDIRLKAMPVVVYSSSISDTMIDALYRAGAHYYMDKCDLTNLTTSIENIFSMLVENSEQPARDMFVVNSAEVPESLI